MVESESEVSRYLMTWGWGLLIIAIIGTAFYSLGVLDPASYQSTTCTRFTYLNYMDHKLSTDGTFQIKVANGPDRINITSIKVGSNMLSFTPTVLNTTQTAIISGSGGPTGDVNTPYSYVVYITYDAVDGISGRMVSSMCTGNFEQ